MKEKLKELEEAIISYGFKARVCQARNSVSVIAKNTDGADTEWFTVCLPKQNKGEVRAIGNNTDSCNVWLNETRKDLTDEDIVNFFDAVERKTGIAGNMLRGFVDPEDWQEITGINDAMDDPRYNREHSNWEEERRESVSEFLEPLEIH